MAALRWDLYCRVVDNLGDAGFCWRLAADLAGRGDRVRLVIDDDAPLSVLAPGGAGAAAGIDVHPWPGPADDPGDIVVEAFGCDLPPACIAAMRARARPPAWIDVEYLSAEPYVERSHRLPSPQVGGLTRWFWFPGYTARTGGLLREPGLEAARARFDAAVWLAGRGCTPRPGERVVSLFCYANDAVPALLRDLQREPTLLLATPGPAQQQVEQALRAKPAQANLRVVALPWLDQPGYDRLLWSCDLNFVRGEDSLVRAIWAGAPFVWQAYPQHDGAHHAKLSALLAQMGAGPAVAAFWRAWNGIEAVRAPGLPQLEPWRRQAAGFADQMRALPDLTTGLRDFATGLLESSPDTRENPPPC